MPNLFALVNNETRMININNVTSMAVIGNKILIKTLDGDSHPVTPPEPFDAVTYFKSLKERLEYIHVGGL